MSVRDINDKDYINLIGLFKDFFKVHNRFQNTDEKVLSYLEEISGKSPGLVYEEDGVIKGALFLSNFGNDTEGNHKLWKLKHFAYTDEAVGKELLDEAEKKVSNSSKTAKIELTIAQSESNIDFYKKNGYKQEGELENHYRFGESTFILSKGFGE